LGFVGRQPSCLGRDRAFRLLDVHRKPRRAIL